MFDLLITIANRQLSDRTSGYAVRAVAPYIVFTSILKVLEDTGTIKPPLNYLLLTPIFYEVTLFIIVFSVLLTKGIAPRLKISDWHVLFGSMGIILSMASLALFFRVWDIWFTLIFFCRFLGLVQS
jgi:uncharacterized membrane protein